MRPPMQSRNRTPSDGEEIQRQWKNPEKGYRSHIGRNMIGHGQHQRRWNECRGDPKEACFGIHWPCSPTVGAVYDRPPALIERRYSEDEQHEQYAISQTP